MMVEDVPGSKMFEYGQGRNFGDEIAVFPGWRNLKISA